MLFQLAYSSVPLSPAEAVVVIALAIGYPLIMLAVNKRRSASANTTILELATRLGFATTPNLRVPSLPRSEVVEELAWNLKPIDKSMETGIEGIYGGKRFHLAEFTSGAGKYIQSWGEIAVAADAHGFQFSLRPENFDHKFMTLLGDRTPKIGDENFDRNWQIETNSDGVLRAMLAPELRAKINATAVAVHGVFILENNWMRYKEGGALPSVSWAASPEDILELMSDLAVAIEVATDQFTPPASSMANGGGDQETDSDWGEKSPEYDDSP